MVSPTLYFGLKEADRPEKFSGEKLNACVCVSYHLFYIRTTRHQGAKTSDETGFAHGEGSRSSGGVYVRVC